MALSAPHDLFDPAVTHTLQRSTEQHCWLYDGMRTKWSDEADAVTVKEWILARYGNVRVSVKVR